MSNASRIHAAAMMAAIASLAPSNDTATHTLHNFDHPMVTPLPVDPHYKPRRRSDAPLGRMFPRSQSEAQTHKAAKRKRKIAQQSKRRNRA